MLSTTLNKIAILNTFLLLKYFQWVHHFPILYIFFSSKPFWEGNHAGTEHQFDRVKRVWYLFFVVNVLDSPIEPSSLGKSGLVNNELIRKLNSCLISDPNKILGKRLLLALAPWETVVVIVKCLLGCLTRGEQCCGGQCVCWPLSGPIGCVDSIVPAIVLSQCFPLLWF